MPALEEFLLYIPNGWAILDVGCGPWYEAKLLVEKGYNYVGIDASPEMLTIARQVVPEACFECIDFRDIHLPWQRFDGCLAIASLLHLPKAEIQNILIQIGNLLTDSGVLLVALKEGDGERLVPMASRKDVERFFAFYTDSEAQTLFASAWYAVVKSYVNTPYEWTTWLTYILGKNKA